LPGLPQITAHSNPSSRLEAFDEKPAVPSHVGDVCSDGGHTGSGPATQQRARAAARREPKHVPPCVAQTRGIMLARYTPAASRAEPCRPAHSRAQRPQACEHRPAASSGGGPNAPAAFTTPTVWYNFVRVPETLRASPRWQPGSKAGYGRWRTWLRWSMSSQQRSVVNRWLGNNAVWRPFVLRSLRVVMIWFLLAFILLALLVQRIVSWARGLLHSN
jgi:hypothetical protein